MPHYGKIVCPSGSTTWLHKCALATKLKLSAAMIEVLWCSTARRQNQISTATFQIASDSVLMPVLYTPASFIRDLGIFIDWTYR